MYLESHIEISIIYANRYKVILMTFTFDLHDNIALLQKCLRKGCVVDYCPADY